MRTSLVYRSSLIYETVMLLLYRKHYWARQRVIAGLVPNGSEVLDVCCGPGLIFDRFLRKNQVKYTGIDLNERFVKRVIAAGGQAFALDVKSGGKLPACDVAIMQASLYQFLPDARGVIELLRQTARDKVIVAEPVQNMANSSFAALRWIAKRNTDPGTGVVAQRFNSQSFHDLAKSFGNDLESLFELPGGREMCMVIRCA